MKSYIAYNAYSFNVSYVRIIFMLAKKSYWIKKQKTHITLIIKKKKEKKNKKKLTAVSNNNLSRNNFIVIFINFMIR